jgi:aspartate racemase
MTEEKLCARSIDVVVLGRAARDYVHNVIYNELCLGKLNPESKDNIAPIILDLQRKGVEGVVLACTELPLSALKILR